MSMSHVLEGGRLTYFSGPDKRLSVGPQTTVYLHHVELVSGPLRG